MITPVALVDRWPGEPYCSQYPTVEQALKANTTDAVLLYHEIQNLTSSFISVDGKAAKAHNKNLELVLREKREQLNRLLKFSDYPAMLVASVNGAKLLDRNRYKELKDSINDPIIIRGISGADLGDTHRRRGLDYYFIETGYFGNYPCKNNRGGRKLFHRVIKNAMQHSKIWDVPDDRWRRLVEFNPALEYQGWKNTGTKVLLVVPSEKPCKYYGVNQEQWIQQTIDEIKKYTNRPVEVRHKDPRWQRSQSTIYEALSNDVWAVVTYNSIAALEAVQFGIPAFALAPTAASPVSSSQLNLIDCPHRPDESLVYKWLSSIAYGQFHMHEFIDGTAWNMVQENEHRKTIDS